MGIETAAMIAIAGGGLMQAGGAISGGNSAKKASKIEAAQLQSQASAVKGDAQRDAIEQSRQARLAQSALIARAAAGGGSASDAGIMNLAGGLEAQGAYNALTALYNGDVRATGLRNQAAMTLYQGDMAKQASRIQAVSGLLQTAGSMGTMYSKYGQGGGTINAPMTDARSKELGITWDTDQRGVYR